MDLKDLRIRFELYCPRQWARTGTIPNEAFVTAALELHHASMTVADLYCIFACREDSQGRWADAGKGGRICLVPCAEESLLADCR